MSRPSVLLVYFKQQLTLGFILKTLILSFLFLSFSLFLVNLLNFVSVAGADYSIFAKLKIFFVFFIGSFETVSSRDLFLLVLISILFGLNLSLVIEKIKFIKKQPNLKLTIGTGILSLGAAGCASCGLSVASIVGIGWGLAVLPFGGIELYFISILILFISLIYNLNSIYKACKI